MTGAVAALAGHSPVFVPVTNIYTTAATATETIPNNATTLTVEVWGGTGSGGTGNGVCPQRGGGGGGAGGYSKTVIAVTGGFTISYTVASIGNSSSVSNGTFTIGTMTANGGVAGANATASVNGAGGAGGTASGGTSTNTTGGSGAAGSACLGGSGASGTVGTNGIGPDGGHGGTGNGNSGRTLGMPGQIIFAYV